MLAPLGQILVFALDVFFWIIIVQVILSWLIAFDVINIRNSQARNLIGLIDKVTEPVYRPLRRFIPPIAGIDITPIIIIFAIKLLQGFIISTFIY